MPAKIYKVTLTNEEREYLNTLISKGKAAAQKLTHAHILLKADQSEHSPAWEDRLICESFNISAATVERVRKTFVEDGIEAALCHKKPCRTRSVKFDGEKEARLIAPACSQPPDGFKDWTLRLLAGKMVELNHFESLSHETVRQVLKKNEIKPWLKKQWVIPPKANAEFVCAMEDILELYKRPHDPSHPLVCMDETSKQQIKEVRIPIPAEPGRPQKYDYEYERNGVSNIFMIFDPLSGQRHVKVTDHRTKTDWAECVKDIVDVYFPFAEKIALTMDNLNTHKPSSLYEAFSPEEARRILDKLEFHYTPKHGSWLNMAEIEFSVLQRQCLDCRIPDQETLKQKIADWERTRNQKTVKVNWQFTTEDARIKLKKLYPSIED